MAQSQDFLSLLHHLGMPKQDWWTQAWTAYHQMCQTLTADINSTEISNHASRPLVSVLPSGNFACELSSHDDVLKCVAFGTVRTDLFVEVAWQNIIGAQDRGVKIEPFEVSENQILVAVSGYTFSVRYHESQELVRLYPAVIDVPRGVQSGLESDVDDVVEALRDLELFKNHVKKNHTFRHLYYTLKYWMMSVGLYEQERDRQLSTATRIRIGCFDAELLRELSWKILLNGESVGKYEDISAMITTYLLQHKQCLGTLTKDECTLYSDLDGPFARSWTNNHFLIAHEEFRNLLNLLAAQGGSDSTNTLPDNNLHKTLKDLAARPFSQKLLCKSYARVTMQYSGQSQLGGTKMMDMVRQRLVDLIKTLEGSMKNACIRPWPTRVVDCQATKNDNPYEGYWLVGISSKPSLDVTPVEPVLTTWSYKVWADHRYSNANMVVGAEMISQEVMLQQEMKEDYRTWPRPLAKPDPRYSLQRVTNDTLKITPPTSIDRSGSPRKLRPALDVLSRLKHDPSFDLDDFVVGYLDRHSGILEKAAATWISESTDEEWIPQGRIQYFKRVSDDCRVWDRATKSDLVFK